MLWSGSAWRQILRCRPACRKPLSTGPSVIHNDIPVEEQTLRYFEPQQYYSARIGAVLQSRYKIIGKLGYGAYSTVWLCRDLRENDFKALKVSTSLAKFPDAMRRELVAYGRLSQVASTHPGQGVIRALLDTFELSGPDGRHQCLLQPPMHISLFEMRQMNKEPLPAQLLKLTLRRLLLALDFLHTEAKMIHTDIKADNLMLDTRDPTIFEQFEKAETAEPSPYKLINQTLPIYLSRKFAAPKEYGLPVLCDLGEAKIGLVQETGPLVQPHQYRAPEVIFEMPWGSPVDIWNTACLIWDLFEERRLFPLIWDSKGNHDPFRHLAQMVGLIGPPPPAFVQRSDTCEQCFDANGKWIADDEAKVSSTTLQDVEFRLSGDDQQRFLAFIRSMLRWLPEERKTAKELLQDPWLQDEV